MPNGQRSRTDKGKIPFGRCQSHHYDHTSSFQTIWHSSCSRMVSGKFAILLERHIFFLSKLLKNSLLTHRLNQALAALIGLSGRCNNVPELFYIAGMEVLKNMPSSHIFCVQFYKNMFLACPGHQQEILLNFALYLVQRQQDVTEGLELLKSKSSKVDFNENPLHKAYIGLFEYLCWQPREDVGNSQLQHDDILYSDDDHEEFSEKGVAITIDYAAKHAMDLFEEVFSEPGVWDIFVPAYLHLLQHCKGVSHAREFLEKYRIKNNLNPNAHRYLYHFLKLNLGSHTELISVLQDLIQLDPTSELLGELVNLKMESGAMENLIELIFQKLDHAGCMWDEETWKMLETYLVVNNVDIKQEVYLAWKERETWWPQYHFHISYNLDVLEKSNVMLAKANVAEYFLGENDFSNKVRLSCGKDQMVIPDKNEDDHITDKKRTGEKRQIGDSNINEIPQMKKTKHK